MLTSLRRPVTIATSDHPSQTRNPHIADASRELLYACLSIQSIIGDLEATDQDIYDLKKGLTELIAAVEAFTNKLATASEEGLDQGLWKLLKRWIVDCKSTMERLGGILDNASKDESRKDIELPIEIKSDTKPFKEQITAYRLAIQLSLQLLHEYVSPFNFLKCLTR